MESAAAPPGQLRLTRERRWPQLINFNRGAAPSRRNGQRAGRSGQRAEPVVAELDRLAVNLPSIWILQVATYDVVRHVRCRTSCTYDIVRATYDIMLNIACTMSYVRSTGCRRTTRTRTQMKMLREIPDDSIDSDVPSGASTG